MAHQAVSLVPLTARLVVNTPPRHTACACIVQLSSTRLRSGDA
jgi:hypothetical protein